MDKVHYEVVEHDGGWAYKVGDVFSERYASHDEAREAAERAAAEQRRPGDTEDIEYQDDAGGLARGSLSREGPTRDRRHGMSGSTHF